MPNKPLIKGILKNKNQSVRIDDGAQHMSSETQSVDQPNRNVYQLVVPQTMRNAFLNLFHDNPTYGTHKSFDKMLRDLARVAYWPSMRRDVRNYVDSCETCAEFKKTLKWKTPLRKYKTPSCPNERLHIDLIGKLDRTTPGHEYILVAVDAFSKFVTLVPLKTKTANEVAEALVNRYISIFGAPKSITSDLGKEFNNQVMEEVSKLHGIKQMLIAPRHPSSNGQVESYNFLICNLLRSVVHGQVRSWHELLPLVASCINSSYNRTIHDTPYHLMFLRDPYIPISVFQQPAITHISNTDDYKEKMKMYQNYLYHRVSKLIDQNFIQMEKQMKRTKLREVKVGDRVYVTVPPIPFRATKLQSRMQGPYRCIRKKSDTVIVIQRLSDLYTTDAHLDNVLVIPERMLTSQDHPNVRRAFPVHDLENESTPVDLTIGEGRAGVDNDSSSSDEEESQSRTEENNEEGAEAEADRDVEHSYHDNEDQEVESEHDEADEEESSGSRPQTADGDASSTRSSRGPQRLLKFVRNMPKPRLTPKKQLRNRTII